ncbi:MAG TPA: putative baseplate assembly protein [Actinomycetota bacterium]
MSPGVPCDCCESGAHAVAANPPGLPAIRYRAGEHGTFLQRMREAAARRGELRSLDVRAPGDWSAALLDAWATSLDVLTFYQERIANEGYLRTATEERSVLDLARTIGYEPRPGAAAATLVAFEMETTPGAPDRVTLEAGLKIQSTPGPGEKAQLFETVEEIEARPAWNAIPVRTSQAIVPSPDAETIYLAGLGVDVKAGDVLLIVGEPFEDSSSTAWNLHRVARVIPDQERAITKVELGASIVAGNSSVAPAAARVFALRVRAAPFGAAAPSYETILDSFKEAIANAGKAPAEILAFENKGASSGDKWPTFAVVAPGTTRSVDLNALYPSVGPGGWVVVAAGTAAVLSTAESVEEIARSDYGIAARVTRLALADGDLDPFDDLVRTTSVYAQSEELTIAATPVTDAVEGDTLTLAARVEGIEPGRTVVVTGTAPGDDSPLAEARAVKTVTPGASESVLVLTAALANTYDPATVRVRANVARATHGETKRELLGGGDASKTFQTFELRGSPLTYLASAESGGATSTLEVRVDDIAWEERPFLNEAGPDDRAYQVRIDAEGTVRIRFGDGEFGARLPTRRQNVAATYRTGLGTSGNLAAGSLDTPLTRPLGLKAATNPLPATGGADPEKRDETRRNAPLAVLALDRVVSLLDFEGYARAFTGITKAGAAWVWDGHAQTVVLTVSGTGGEPPAEVVRTNLASSIRDRSDLRLPFVVLGHEPRTFELRAAIVVEAGHRFEDVRARVEAALRSAYGFDARDPARPVTESGVVAVVQREPGVVGVRLERLAFTGQDAPPTGVLGASPARFDGGLRAAELLTIDPAATAIQVTEVTA